MATAAKARRRRRRGGGGCDGDGCAEILNDVAFGHKELMQTPSTKIFKYSLRLQQTWMTEGHKSILNISYKILTLYRTLFRE